MLKTIKSIQTQLQTSISYDRTNLITSLIYEAFSNHVCAIKIIKTDAIPLRFFHIAVYQYYSISNRADFEALVKQSLSMQQTDRTKKQQKRIPQITTRLEQIDRVLNKLYEDNALDAIPHDRYEQMSQKY